MNKETMNKTAKMTPNGMKYCIRFSCIAVSMLFAGGAFLQAFLAENGVSAEKISTLVAAMNTAQMVTILLFSSVVDRMKHVIGNSARFIAGMGVYFAVMAFLAFSGAASSGLLYGIALGAGVVLYIFYGLYAVSDYRLPYQIIDMKDYAHVTGTCGVMGGAISVGISALAAFLIASLPMNPVMGSLYLLSLFSLAGAVYMTKRLRPIPFAPSDISQKKHIGLLATLHLPMFWKLLLPNLMRGFNTGIIGMMATIGMHEMGLTAAQTSAMALVYTVMGVAGGYGFMRLSAKRSSASLCLFAGILMAAAMPLLMLGKQFYFFLGLYAAVLFAMQLVDYTVPVILVDLIPYECIGSFTSLRLGTHSGGIALGSMAVGIALSSGSSVLLLLFSGLLQLISSIVYYRSFQAKR